MRLYSVPYLWVLCTIKTLHFIFLPSTSQHCLTFFSTINISDQKGWHRIKQWPAEHGWKLHLKPKIFITPRAYFSTKLTPKISDFLDCVTEVHGSKHWPYTVAHTFDCVCSKINKSWFNQWFSFYFSSLYPAPYIE